MFQNFAETSKNVKNITLTLADRQQMRAASVFYRGMFSNETVILPQEVTYKKNITDESTFHRELRQFMSDKDMLTNEITVMEQLYKNGDLIVVQVEDCDQVKVGLIQSILVRGRKVFFVCKIYTCTRHWLQFFESKTSEDHCSFVDSSKLADYKPLIKRGTTIKFQFNLHHRISFSHSN